MIQFLRLISFLNFLQGSTAMPLKLNFFSKKYIYRISSKIRAGTDLSTKRFNRIETKR